MYVHLQNQRTFHPLIIDDFPAMWYVNEKLSAEFFVSSVRIIDVVGFLSFSFEVLLEQLLKSLLNL